MLALQSEANVCRHKKSRLSIAQDTQQKLGVAFSYPERNKPKNRFAQNATCSLISCPDLTPVLALGDLGTRLHVVNSQNVYHELCFKSKTILYHVDLSFFAGSNSVYFLHELKQRSNDVTGQHQWLVDSEVLLGSTQPANSRRTSGRRFSPSEKQ